MENDTTLIDTITQEHGSIFLAPNVLLKYGPIIEAVTVKTRPYFGGFVTVCEVSYREKVSGRERDFYSPVLRVAAPYRHAKASPEFLKAAELVAQYVRQFTPTIELRDATHTPPTEETDFRKRLAGLLG